MRTIPAREVQVVKRSSDWFAPKSGPWVDVDIDGTPVRLEHGMFNARDLSVGNKIAVVVDPADQNHVVAVGGPGAWDDTTSDWVITAVFAGVTAAFFSFLVAAFFLGPEIEAWENRRYAAWQEKRGASHGTR